MHKTMRKCSIIKPIYNISIGADRQVSTQETDQKNLR